MEFQPYDPDQRETTKSRRHLPHWQQDGAASFVTFRLADSIPKSKLDQWRGERDEWMRIQSKLEPDPSKWPAAKRAEFRAQFGERIDRWTDQGYGACELRASDTRQIIEEAIRFFDRTGSGNDERDDVRYVLDEFVIMPNHIHLLVIPTNGFRLTQIVHSWKSFTAHKVNQHLERTGTLWMDERFDHLVRSRLQLERFRSYIRDNPMKARLPEDDFTLGKGSGIQ